MKHTVTLTNDNHSMVLSWLQENIGDLLHSQPIIFWHGKGWHMKFVKDKLSAKFLITVDFDTPEHATWFGLVWQ